MRIRDRIKEFRTVKGRDLLPNPKNWRTHPTAQADAMRGLLAEVGQVDVLRAVETPNGLMLVDGHLRGEVAPDSDWRVAVLDLTPAEADKVLATFDPIGDMAGADPEKLTALLTEIQTDSEAVAKLLAELQAESGAEPTVEPGAGGDEFDATPETSGPTRTQVGDVWVIGGKHRLAVGDCTDAGVVGRLMDRAKPFLCVTDPPYGVDYDPEWRNKAAAEGHLAYAASRVGKVTNDDRADWSAAWAMTPCDVIYSWHPPGAPSLIHAKALQDSGFVLRMQIIWAKSNFPIGRGDYHVRHEPCWYAVREGVAARRTDDRTQTTLWEINLDKNVEGGHSTQKPLECMARAIRNHECESVYDPFLGSGTTLIAAHRLGRVCYGCEIEPRYGDVILKRAEAEGLTCEVETAYEWDKFETVKKAHKNGTTKGRKKKNAKAATAAG